MIDQAFITAERLRSERFMGLVFALMAWTCVGGAFALARAGAELGLAPDVAEGAALALLTTAIADTALLFLWQRIVRAAR